MSVIVMCRVRFAFILLVVGIQSSMPESSMYHK